MANLEKIIEACKENNREAQKELYERFGPTLFAVCLRYTRNRMEAEDFLHEGFIKIFEKIGQYQGRGPLEGWMRRLMVNTILESFRKNARWKFTDESELLEAREPLTPEEEEQEGDYSLQQLHALIEQLPERYRLVFKLYVLEDYTHDEIAHEMGISSGTSKSNLARARQWLRTRLEESKVIKEKAI